MSETTDNPAENSTTVDSENTIANPTQSDEDSQEALLERLHKNEALTQSLLAQNVQAMQALKKQLEQKQKQERRDKTISEDIDEVIKFIRTHLDMIVAKDDPMIVMLVYIRQAIRQEQLNETDRLNEFLTKFDERLEKAERFSKAIEDYQAVIIDRITAEHYEQRIATANNLTKTLNDALNQGAEKIKEATNTEPKSSKLMTYLLYGLLGLGIINLVV